VDGERDWWTWPLIILTAAFLGAFGWAVVSTVIGFGPGK
jgi:hypothetical protein